MLEAKGVTVAFGAITAFDNVDLRLNDNEIVALVGHNGAGKTTLLRSMCGLQRVNSGTISLNGEDVTWQPAEALAQKALAFVPQGRSVFTEMSVSDNLKIARSASSRPGMSDEQIFDLFPVLAEKRDQRAGSLSGGQQQMLALSLALVRGPSMILLDEPSTGLAPVLVQTVFETIRRLHSEFGTAFLVIDQNVEQLLALASRAYVLKAGRMVYDGAAAGISGPDLWKYF